MNNNKKIIKCLSEKPSNIIRQEGPLIVRQLGPDVAFQSQMVPSDLEHVVFVSPIQKCLIKDCLYQVDREYSHVRQVHYHCRKYCCVPVKGIVSLKRSKRFTIVK